MTDDERLGVLLWRRTGNTEHGRWALPGSFLRPGERLADAVARTLRDKCGVVGLAPTQLGVMDTPGRDDRGWVLSVAHLDVVRAEALGVPAADGLGADGLGADGLGADGLGNAVRIAPVRAGLAPQGGSVIELPDRQRRLPFDHESIVELAVAELRGRYATRPDPAGLLGERFTMLALRRLHEAVAGEPLQKDTFRRVMTPLLRQTDAIAPGVVGRPARLFQRRPASRTQEASTSVP